MGFLDPKPATPNWIVAQINAVGSAIRNAIESIFALRYDPAEADSTARIQAALDAAHAANRAKVFIRAGDWKLSGGLTIPPKVWLVGIGGGTARFGHGDGASWGGVNLIRPLSSTNQTPMVDLPNGGSGLVNVHLNANGGTGVSLRQSGFEVTVDHVRMISGTGMAWDVQKANNGRISYVYVDNYVNPVGTPAVLIQSVAGAGSAPHTNAQVFNQVTIERCRGTHLQIGDSTQTEVEYCIFNDPHIEAPDDSGGAYNTVPLVDVRHASRLTFVNPFFYGGPGALIRHDQSVMTHYAAGGLTLIGGQLLGQEAASPSNMLVHLMNGSGFTAVATAFDRYVQHAIRIDSTYGAKAHISPSCTFSGTEIQDSRTAPSVSIHYGDNQFRGRVLDRSANQPTATSEHASVTNVAITTARSSEVSGVVTWGTGASPATGNQVKITFPRAYTGRTPRITITPETVAAANLNYHVGVTMNEFYIRSANVPAASIAAGGFAFAYEVRG